MCATTTKPDTPEKLDYLTKSKKVIKAVLMKHQIKFSLLLHRLPPKPTPPAKGKIGAAAATTRFDI